MANRRKPRIGEITGDTDVAVTAARTVKPGSKEWLASELSCVAVWFNKWDIVGSHMTHECPVCMKGVRIQGSARYSWKHSKEVSLRRHLRRHTKKELMSTWMSLQIGS